MRTVDRVDRAAYSDEAEAFLASLMVEYYEHSAGLKESLEISPIYHKHRRLFRADAVRALLGDRASREGLYLAQFAASNAIEDSLRGMTERIATGESQATVSWDGGEVPYRQAGILVANEPDPARRRDLEARTAHVTAQLNPTRRDRLARSHQLAVSLGFRDYVAMCDELWGLGLAWLGAAMDRLLAQTRDAYRELLSRRLAAAGVSPAEATTADLAYVRRGLEFDALFPKDRLLPALRQTLAGLGIELEAQANVSLDVDERPLKSPRAFCAPVRVPGDVRLVIRPRGGHTDFETLLHEAGHLEHFANTRAEAPFAYRCLGDNSVTEGYAFLLGNLVAAPAWLRDVLEARDLRGYLELSRLGSLYYLRRYAAKLAYELDLHRAADPGALADRYAAMLGGALDLRVRPENWLQDVDDFLYCACYLRAWIFEVQLRQRLVSAHGERWFSSREAGAVLRDLWALGQEYTADELARRLGYDGLDVDPLIADLTRSAD